MLEKENDHTTDTNLLSITILYFLIYLLHLVKHPKSRFGQGIYRKVMVVKRKFVNSLATLGKKPQTLKTLQIRPANRHKKTALTRKLQVQNDTHPPTHPHPISLQSTQYDKLYKSPKRMAAATLQSLRVGNHAHTETKNR